jgi:hypothetical protein
LLDRASPVAVAQDLTPMFAASSLLHAGWLATTSLNTILEFDYAPDKDETRGFLLRNWRAEAFDTSGKSPAHLQHRNYWACAGTPAAGFFNRAAMSAFHRSRHQAVRRRAQEAAWNLVTPRHSGGPPHFPVVGYAMLHSRESGGVDVIS